MEIILFVNISFIGVYCFFLIIMVFFDKIYTNKNDDTFDDENICNNNTQTITKTPIQPYEEKYLDKFNDLKIDNDVTIRKKRSSELTNCYVFENTTLGNVIMFYRYYQDDEEISSFVYYSDYTIPYRFLETIARKYCITFKCKHIYADTKEELKKHEEELKKHEEELKKYEEELKMYQHDNKEKTSTKTIQPVRSVFAKFKTYKQSDDTNNNTNINIGNNYIDNNNIDDNNNNNNNVDYALKKNILTKIKNDNNSIKKLKEKINRFTYLGKLNNFSFIQKKETNSNTRKINDKITYKDFKKNIKI